MATCRCPPPPAHRGPPVRQPPAPATRFPTSPDQTRFYEAVSAVRRAGATSGRIEGIEGVLREIFPIESYDKTVKIEYLRYELGKPRYDA